MTWASAVNMSKQQFSLEAASSSGVAGGAVNYERRRTEGPIREFFLKFDGFWAIWTISRGYTVSSCVI